MILDDESQAERRSYPIWIAPSFISCLLTPLNYRTKVPQKLISASKARAGREGLKCSMLLNRMYLTVASGSTEGPGTNSKSRPLLERVISSFVGAIQGSAVPLPEG